MNRSQMRRLWIVVFGLTFLTVVIIGRLFAFQIISGEQWRSVGQGQGSTIVTDRPDRGIVYDRQGSVLATNAADYQVAASPDLMTDREREAAAIALAPIIQTRTDELMDKLNAGAPYVILAARLSREGTEAIRANPALEDLELVPLPRRYYPQGNLMSHVLGYVNYENVGQSGVEGEYHVELAGKVASADVFVSPLRPQPNVIAEDGANLVLTIDRAVQRTVERHLEAGLHQYNAQSGTIIVMDPRNGEILAMASKPDFTPYNYFEQESGLLKNPSVTNMYEPGSVMKLVTMAAALDSGTVTSKSTYFDTGVLAVGGSLIYNWDRSGPGETDMTTLLRRSLNVGASTIAMWMGAEQYYDYMVDFNFGRPLGIDLSAEAPGLMPLPGDDLWTEESLATNAFGQGMTTTPIQMLSAVSALANGGTLMRPHVVKEIHPIEGEPMIIAPEAIAHPVSQQTADQLTTMAVAAVRGEVLEAQVPGYTIAGKTGTAQIPEGGIYHPDDVIGSFIGWLPADNPEMIVLIKIDRPQIAEAWGSTTAAPIFSQLVSELVTILNIPPDGERLKADIWQARQGTTP